MSIKKRSKREGVVPMKITVLGSGGWGTALALLLLDNGNEVTLWSFDPAEAEVLRTTR